MEDSVILEDHGNFKVIATRDSAGNYTNVREVYVVDENPDFSVGTTDGVNTSNYHFIGGSPSGSGSYGSADSSSSGQSSGSYYSGSNSYGGSGINWKKVLIFAALMLSVTIVGNIALAFTAFFELDKCAVPGAVTVIVSAAVMILSIYKSRKKYWHKKRYISLAVIAGLALIFGIYLILCGFGIFDINALIGLIG